MFKNKKKSKKKVIKKPVKKVESIYHNTYDDDCLVEEHNFGRIGKLTDQGESIKVSVRRSAINVSISN